MYKIILEKRVKRRLDRFSKNQYKRASEAIWSLSEFPFKGDLKKFKGSYPGMYRLRIGGWRVLFQVDEKTKEIRVFKIDTRGDIY